MGQQSDDLYMGTATGPQTNSWASGGNPGVIGQGVGPLGRVYIFDIVPVALSATAVCASQTAAAAGNATINGASATNGVATFDVARTISIVSTSASDTSTLFITVTGTDYYGQPQTEKILFNGTSTRNGLKAFKTITQAAVSAALTGSLSVGSGDTFGLPYRVTDAGYLLRTGWNNTVSDNAGTFTAADTTSPATSTTGDVRGTFLPASTAANGSRRLVIAIGLTAIQAGPTATQTGAIGVTPV
jgi:hypothetical protein